MRKAKDDVNVTSKAFNPRLKRVAKTSISDEIVSQILHLVGKGDLRPGEKLPSERELCLKFGAGRSSLREALRCLCILGVLRARAGEGTIVDLDGGRFFGKIVEWRIITEQPDINEMMELRIALESVIAASAASRRGAEDLAKLQQLMDGMAAAVDQKQRFAALDVEFHLLLAEVSENNLIRNLVSMIRRQLEMSVSRALELPNARPLSMQEHQLIFQAVKRGDAADARSAMTRHLSSAMERYRNAPLRTDSTEPKLMKIKRKVGAA